MINIKYFMYYNKAKHHTQQTHTHTHKKKKKKKKKKKNLK